MSCGRCTSNRFKNSYNYDILMFDANCASQDGSHLLGLADADLAFAVLHDDVIPTVEKVRLERENETKS